MLDVAFDGSAPARTAYAGGLSRLVRSSGSLSSLSCEPMPNRANACACRMDLETGQQMLVGSHDDAVRCLAWSDSTSFASSPNSFRVFFAQIT